jgi:hypothetical protein
MLLNQALFRLPPSEIRQYGAENLTYGSLTDVGIGRLVERIKTMVKGPICGFDLGCGDGELIYHLQNLLSDSEWEGVEISEHRVSMQRNDLRIWQGDMLSENYHPYNVLHADNLCLDSLTADRLELKIAHEFTGLYITYRKPENYEFLRRSLHLESVPIETTWNLHDIHFYRVF